MRVGRLLKNTWKNRTLVLMALPAVTLFIMFSYIPMFGLVMAFKKFNYADGIWNSPWNGLENFRFLFMAKDTSWRLIRNTVGYYLLFTVFCTIGEIAIAILINEMRCRRTAKYCQSAMILPVFISYIAVSFVLTSLLDSKDGMINRLLLQLGQEPISFYMKAEYWPVILVIVKVWKGCGYGSVLYLATLTGIDQSLYEAADCDGASGWDKMRYITIPMLMPMVTVMTLLSLGDIMNSDTGLFFQVTKNVGALYPTTQVFSSYVLNSIATNTEFGMTAAATFFQEIVGFVMVVSANMVVRKVDPDRALF